MPNKKNHPVSRPAHRRNTIRPVATGLATGTIAAKALTQFRESKAKTIVFIHGIGNKPTEDALKSQWDRALFGYDLGERSRMAYWVNRARHGPPMPAAADPDAMEEMAVRGLGKAAITPDHDASLLPTDARADALPALRRLEAEMLEGAAATADEAPYGKKILPWFMRPWVTRWTTRMFLADAHDYLFVPAAREFMRQSLITRLRTGGGPFVVVAHSQGTMIAYDVLKTWDEVAHGPIDVPLFVTMGSPLGLSEIKDQIKKFTAQKNVKKLAIPDMVGQWINVADRLDSVALDSRLASDYAPRERITDLRVENPDSRNPHSGSGYLQTDAVRSAVTTHIHRSLFQAVSNFTVSKDTVRAVDRDPFQRHPVLIELQHRKPNADDWMLRDGGEPDDTKPAASAGEAGIAVAAWILQRVRASLVEAEAPANLAQGSDDAIAQHIDLEILSAYASARLTRSEIEELAATMRGLNIIRVFKNGVKRRHLNRSIDTVQARTAHRGYAATGKGITWAVLDTEVDARHPHFNFQDAPPTIERSFSCTGTDSKPLELPEIPRKQTRDLDGHGTHVAGIIAGRHPEYGLTGIAPDATLWSYKVLGDTGEGSDAKIIKALDHIYTTNRQTGGELKIHGVNLSLGGPFDAESFGCGDTPLCRELRKLWRQGVVVVISAGNEGQHAFPGCPPLNTFISIGDPANLDESIVVGSIHATKPHLYGISHFSSRGPTADGRSKPDLVAPGEKILSCRALNPKLSAAYPKSGPIADFYTALSGTSMAAPHVSGVLACFLSARPEFIGYPDRVKKILIGSCTDLGRDPQCQGAGMVNLVKMLLNH